MRGPAFFVTCKKLISGRAETHITSFCMNLVFGTTGNMGAEEIAFRFRNNSSCSKGARESESEKRSEENGKKGEDRNSTCLAFETRKARDRGRIMEVEVE